MSLLTRLHIATRNREESRDSVGSVERGSSGVKAWTCSFSPRRSSSLSFINEYLARYISGNVILESWQRYSFALQYRTWLNRQYRRCTPLCVAFCLCCVLLCCVVLCCVVLCCVDLCCVVLCCVVLCCVVLCCVVLCCVVLCCVVLCCVVLCCVVLCCVVLCCVVLICVVLCCVVLCCVVLCCVVLCCVVLCCVVLCCGAVRPSQLCFTHHRSQAHDSSFPVTDLKPPEI